MRACFRAACFAFASSALRFLDASRSALSSRPSETSLALLALMVSARLTSIGARLSAWFSLFSGFLRFCAHANKTEEGVSATAQGQRQGARHLRLRRRDRCAGSLARRVARCAGRASSGSRAAAIAAVRRLLRLRRRGGALVGSGCGCGLRRQRVRAPKQHYPAFLRSAGSRRRHEGRRGRIRRLWRCRRRMLLVLVLFGHLVQVDQVLQLRLEANRRLLGKVDGVDDERLLVRVRVLRSARGYIKAHKARRGR